MFPGARSPDTDAGAVFCPQLVLDTGLAFVLDLLSPGIVLTDQDARKVYANASAMHMISGSGPIRCSGSLLAGESRKATLALRKAIRWACAERPAAITDIPLPFLDGRPAIARVVPAPTRYAVGSNTVTAAVVITALNVQHPPIEAMATLYALTSSEVKVLASVLQARNRGATAQHLGLAPSTIKTHLTRIYAKTGTSSQHQLNQLATRLTVPLAQPRWSSDNQ